ncbi:MAG: DUF3842 family protein [Candidatus Geothermincolia bacterium]
MIIAVVDGMGGSIGHELVRRLRSELPEETEIIVLGTNAIATGNMMKARASRGATGENAIAVSIPEADIVMGSLSIVVPNSMMGELTPGMAAAIASSRARKVLVPLTNPRLDIIGVSEVPLPKLIQEAVGLVERLLRGGNEDV